MGNDSLNGKNVNGVKWNKVKKIDGGASKNGDKKSDKKEEQEIKYKRIIAGLLTVIFLMLLVFLGNRYILRKAATEVSVFSKIEDMADSVLVEEESRKAVPITVNINTAGKLELMQLKGIGEKKAEEIIEYRNNNGNFASIEQLKDVNGIGEKVFNEIKDFVVIS